MHCANDPALFDFENNGTRRFIHALMHFQRVYMPIHGKICVFLCVFGVATNLLHCLVLTRPKMRNSAVNCIMTAVALCDLGTMSSYLVYIIHFVLQNSPESCSNNYTYAWMCFLLLHMFFSITLHTTTLWLAVLMAFLRRMTLHRNILNSHWQKSEFAKILSLVVAGVVFILSVPSFLIHKIIEYPEDRWIPPSQCRSNYPSNYTEKIYTIVISQSALANGCVIFKTNLWLTGILFKVIPCLLLILLSASLMQRLREADRKRSLLMVSNGLGASHSHNNNNDSDKPIAITAAVVPREQPHITKSRTNSDRTTLLLLAILVVFLLTEFPQGVLAILNAVYTTDVHRFIYLTLGDMLDLLSLMNSSVNFVLYCLMSSRYRQTFCSLLMPFACRRCVTAEASAMQSTHFFGANTNLNTENLPLANRLLSVPSQHYNGNANSSINRSWMTLSSKRRRSTPSYRWIMEQNSGVENTELLKRPRTSQTSFAINEF